MATVYVLLFILGLAVIAIYIDFTCRYNDLQDVLALKKIKYDALKEDFDEYRKGALKREEGYLDHFKNVNKLLTSLNNDFDTHRHRTEHQFKIYDDGNEMMSATLIDHTRWLERLDEMLIVKGAEDDQSER